MKFVYSNQQSTIINEMGRGADVFSFSGGKTRWQNETLLKYRQTYLKEIPKRRVWVFIPLSLVSNGSEIW
jgi:hypothetical protein